MSADWIMSASADICVSSNINREQRNALCSAPNTGGSTIPDSDEEEGEWAPIMKKMRAGEEKVHAIAKAAEDAEIQAVVRTRIMLLEARAEMAQAVARYTAVKTAADAAEDSARALRIQADCRNRLATKGASELRNRPGSDWEHRSHRYFCDRGLRSIRIGRQT